MSVHPVPHFVIDPKDPPAYDPRKLRARQSGVNLLGTAVVFDQIVAADSRGTLTAAGPVTRPPAFPTKYAVYFANKVTTKSMEVGGKPMVVWISGPPSRLRRRAA
jgi:hypothetical protein